MKFSPRVKPLLSPCRQGRLFPFYRIGGNPPRPYLVSVAVRHGHADARLATMDEAYGVVVVAFVYFPILLSADCLVVFQPGGNRTSGVTQLDAAGGEAIMPFAVRRFQDEAGQSAQLPGTFTDGDFIGEPCAPVSSLEVAFRLPAGHAQQRVGLFGQLPAGELQLLFVADPVAACHCVLRDDLSGRETLADDFGHERVAVLVQVAVDGLLRRLVGNVGIIDGVADVLAVAVEFRYAAAHLQYHGLFQWLLLLDGVQVETGFVLHAQLQVADGVRLSVFFGHE